MSDRLGYGSALFASVMRQINDVTCAKVVCSVDATGVNTTLNAVRERSAVKAACCVLRGLRFREEAWLPSYEQFDGGRFQAANFC